jgi:putative OPT family oligopeptide transporter
MGAANVYLGLKAGMTVAASIPASVIAMGILHGVMRRKSLLESNLVQTSASAGESLAAGIIFTMPALILIGVWQTFDFWTTTLVAMAGGLLGILFMIPMRRVFVVENTELAYPEGVACAEVLRAGEGGDGREGTAQRGALVLFGSLGVGAVFKFVGSFLGFFKSAVEFGTYAGSRVFVVGADISPALVGVGYIVGIAIASQVFMGGLIGWVIAIPLMGADPGAGSAIDQASTLWSTRVRYIGVGAMVVGGISSIWRVRRSLVAATREIASQMNRPAQTGDVPGTERDLSGKMILALSFLCVAIIAGLYYTLLGGGIGITALTTIIMIVMSFFFTAVATYIVGLVGSSNSPVSGMTICAVLGTGGLLYVFGYSGVEGMIATLGVAGIVCCVACTSGDTSNDLKTGYLVGASPRLQQFMQVLGVLVASFVMAPVLVAIHQGSINNGTGGIGGRELPAPQAGLFASLADGFFGEGQLPWDMIGWGVGIGLGILLLDGLIAATGSSFRLHVMPVAVGIYLPLGLSAPIFIGGIIHWLVARRAGSVEHSSVKRGVLIASGLVAGESLLGVLLAILAYFNITSLHLGELFAGIISSLLGAWAGEALLDGLSILAMAALLFWMYRLSIASRGS